LIQYLDRKDIDTQKWDGAISADPNGFPYGYSGYLDAATSQKWKALVKGDYEQVMPLPWNGKLLGLKQIYPPVFSQQLGVFGKEVSETDLQAFIGQIPSAFVLTHTTLHHPNARSLSSLLQDSNLSLRTNLTLSLQEPYPTIRKRYHKNLRNEINKANRINHLEFHQDAVVHLKFCLEHLHQKVTFSSAQKIQMEQVLAYLINTGQGLIAQAKDQSGEILASGFFIQTHHRVINLFSSSTLAGRKHFSMHFILDQIIQKYADQPLIFDFEGSELPGVAQFFKRFGATEEPYLVYLRDQQPRWLKVLKSIRR